MKKIDEEELERIHKQGRMFFRFVFIVWLSIIVLFITLKNHGKIKSISTTENK
jgi:hypothetical protein